MAELNADKLIAAKNERVLELRDLNKHMKAEQYTVRDIMNNRRALVALLGKTIKDPSQRLPIANLMQRADTVLGVKLGGRPDIKVDPPATSDSDLARKKADKRARTVEWLDDETDLESILPQVGRWVPGYGYVAASVQQGRGNASRQNVAMIEMFDPCQTFPGEWGTKQQPLDMDVCYVIGRRKLAAMYPRHEDKIMGRGYKRGPGGAVMLDSVVGSNGTWSNQGSHGIEVHRYYDERGCWWLCPEIGELLSFEPNIIKDDVTFRIAKRYSFDELVGHYDSAIGVMAYQARLALLAAIATEDAVMSETNIVGDLKGDEYRRGRNAVNHFTPGTVIDKMNSRVPFEAFTMIDRTERQLRLIMGHDAQRDGESDLSFATGRGLDALQASGGEELREYRGVFRRWVRSLDRLRLEWMEVAYKDTTFTMNGVQAGTPFAESMTPGVDIKGDYTTRRVYGAMAGFDDATKIITGLQLLQAGIIDEDTLREQLDGLENHSRIRERVREKEIEAVAMEALKALIAAKDPKAIVAATKMLPAGEMRNIFEEVFLSEDEEPVAPPPAPMGPPPDVTTVMSRLTPGGGTGGVQSVGRVA
jgi:hypothetical protein